MPDFSIINFTNLFYNRIKERAKEFESKYLMLRKLCRLPEYKRAYDLGNRLNKAENKNKLPKLRDIYKVAVLFTENELQKIFWEKYRTADLSDDIPEFFPEFTDEERKAIRMRRQMQREEMYVACQCEHCTY
jgi:hypothetical protein